MLCYCRIVFKMSETGDMTNTVIVKGMNVQVCSIHALETVPKLPSARAAYSLSHFCVSLDGG